MPDYTNTTFEYLWNKIVNTCRPRSYFMTTDILISCGTNDISIIHYTDVIMGTIASQITSLTVVYSIVYSDADQRKHHSSASLAFVWGIHRGPVNSPHKWPVTRKMFPFDGLIMIIKSQWKFRLMFILIATKMCGDRTDNNWITAISRM